jgi:hypothetical protein
MLKNIFSTCFVIIVINTVSMAQDKLGFTGLFGTYHMSMLPNVDDKNAGELLQFVQTFKYGAGLEKATWFNNNFGVGGQVSYWLTGQDYKGKIISLPKSTYTASTELSYTKLGLYLFHKSYNRYKPNAKFRFLSYFGPYVAYRIGYTDQITIKDSTGKIIGNSTFVPGGIENNLVRDTLFRKFKEPLYTTIDFGFTIAPGFQLMLTPKMAIGFNVRADLGGTSVENNKNLREIIPLAPYEKEYTYWNTLTAKYQSSIIPKDPFDRRGETFNSSFGAIISLRFYTQRQFDKF